MSEAFHRRTFLRSHLPSGAALALAGHHLQDITAQTGIGSRKVVVVGAGIAGLVAAFELMHGASNAVRSLLQLTFLGEDFDYVSALQDVIWQQSLDKRTKWYRIRGGNDLLPRALAQRLRDRIHYGTALQRLAQDNGKCTLSITRAVSLQQLEPTA